MMTETFAESNQAVSARSLYVALTELASDTQSETFTATKALIAHKAALSISTVARLLSGFEQIGVVHIERRFAERNAGAIRAPNTYTLLALGHGDLTTLGHRSKHGSNPEKVEESGKILEESKENTLKRGTRHLLRKVTLSVPFDSDFDFDKEGLLDSDAHEAIAYYNNKLTPLGFLPVTKISPELERALEVFDGDDIRSLVDSVIENPDDAPKRKTLVRLIWDNY
jgi:hypothetical protein